MTDREHDDTTEWVHCNQCLRSTRHDVIATRVVREPEELTNDDSGAVEYVITWETTYSVLECRGCGGVSLRRRLTSDGPPVDETTYYPPEVSRQRPRWLYELPDDFRNLLSKSYVALHAGSRRLAIMGARCLIDLFMTKMVGDVGGFQQKLQKLVDKGFLSAHNKSTLEAALETGHAVSHRGHLPKDDHVNMVFDIVENLLQAMVLGAKADRLKKETPKRKSNNTLRVSSTRGRVDETLNVSVMCQENIK